MLELNDQCELSGVCWSKNESIWLDSSRVKTLRVLIVEACDFHRLMIEKMFNGLGCYGVAPVASLDQLFIHVQYAHNPFDIVLLNYDLALRAGLDIYEYCAGESRIKNIMVYNASALNLIEISPSCLRAGLFSLPLGVSLDALKVLISVVDVNSRASVVRAL